MAGVSLHKHDSLPWQPGHQMCVASAPPSTLLGAYRRSLSHSEKVWQGLEDYLRPPTSQLFGKQSSVG